VLEVAGHDVQIAYDPIVALSTAQTFKPEIAVLDIGLPVMDGYELAVLLRESAETMQCRLIALTGYGQDHDRQRSQAAGFERHLVKPIDAQELLRIVSHDPPP
jgi:CheY-like chemotaxis protein